MLLPSPLTRLLFACIALMLGVAQVAGAVGGFICQCSGTAMMVAVDHCHGPHGAHCHDAATAAEEAHHGRCDGADSEKHAPTDTSLAFTHSVTPAPVTFSPALVAVLPASDFSPRFTALQLPWRESSTAPPISVAIARTLVLRI